MWLVWKRSRSSSMWMWGQMMTPESFWTRMRKWSRCWKWPFFACGNYTMVMSMSMLDGPMIWFVGIVVSVTVSCISIFIYVSISNKNIDNILCNLRLIFNHNKLILLIYISLETHQKNRTHNLNVDLVHNRDSLVYRHMHEVYDDNMVLDDMVSCNDEV